MRTLVLLVLSGILSVHGEGPIHFDVAKASDLFEKFIKDFNKKFKDDADKEVHLEQFKKNLEVLNELNKKNYPGATFGINQFSDLSKEEMKEHKGYIPQKHRSTGK